MRRAATGSSDGRRVAGHPPALVEVDHDGHRVADRGARRGDRGQPLVEALPARVDPDLQRPEALLAQAQGRLGPLGGRQQHPARGVGGRCRRSRRRTASRPAARRPCRRCPTGPPRAASSDRRGSRSSRGPGRAGRWPADPARRTGARTPRTRPSCRPTRCRRRPRRSRRARWSPGRRSAARGPRPPGTAGRAGPQTLEPDRGDAHGDRSIPHRTRWGSLDPAHDHRPGLRPRHRPRPTARRSRRGHVVRARPARPADHRRPRRDPRRRAELPARDPDLDDLPLPAHAGDVRLRRPRRRRRVSARAAPRHRARRRSSPARSSSGSPTPVLAMLVEETGETAVIVRRLGLGRDLPARGPVAPRAAGDLEPGSSWPLHAGALAKVLLAYAEPEILEEVVAGGLPPITAATPSETRAAPVPGRDRPERGGSQRGRAHLRLRGHRRSHPARRRDRGRDRRHRPVRPGQPRVADPRDPPAPGRGADDRRVARRADRTSVLRERALLPFDNLRQNA